MHIFFDFFFFQAEDGIRDIGVTGVQTCALPISLCLFERHGRLCRHASPEPLLSLAKQVVRLAQGSNLSTSSRIAAAIARSEERRVGKECRSRGWAEC